MSSLLTEDGEYSPKTPKRDLVKLDEYRRDSSGNAENPLRDQSQGTHRGGETGRHRRPRLVQKEGHVGRRKLFRLELESKVTNTTDSRQQHS